MPTDPYANRVSLQLIETPAASSRDLDAARRGAPPPSPSEAASSLASARFWAETLLEPAYAPPKGTTFLAFRREAGLYDVVRARYKVDAYEIEVAQTKYLVSIRVTGVMVPAGASDTARAQDAARKFLAGHNRFQFERVGVFAHRTYGRQNTSAKGSIDPDWPHWVDGMHWWAKDAEVGFWTIKATGGPTRAPIGPAEELNEHWF